MTIRQQAISKLFVLIIGLLLLLVAACNSKPDLPEPWKSMDLPIEGAEVGGGTKETRFSASYRDIDAESDHRKVFESYKKALEKAGWEAMYQKHERIQDNPKFQAILAKGGEKLLVRIEYFKDLKGSYVTLSKEPDEVSNVEKILSNTPGSRPEDPKIILGVP